MILGGRTIWVVDTSSIRRSPTIKQGPPVPERSDYRGRTSDRGVRGSLLDNLIMYLPPYLPSIIHCHCQKFYYKSYSRSVYELSH